jgi:rhodanese-related sulfurtransferase
MNMRERKPYRRIDVATALSLVDDAETLLLDVRDPASF